MPKIKPGSESVKMLQKMLAAEEPSIQSMFEIVDLISSLESSSYRSNESTQHVISRFTPHEAYILKSAIEVLNKESHKEKGRDLNSAQIKRLNDINQNYGSLIAKLASEYKPTILPLRIETEIKRKTGFVSRIVNWLPKPYRTNKTAASDIHNSNLTASSSSLGSQVSEKSKTAIKKTRL